MRLFRTRQTSETGFLAWRVSSLRDWAPACSMAQRSLVPYTLPDTVPQSPTVRSVAARDSWRPFRVGAALRARTLSVRAMPLPAHPGFRAPLLYRSRPQFELNRLRWSRRKACRMPSLRRLTEGKPHSETKMWRCLAPRRDEGYPCVPPADDSGTGCPPPLST